MFETINVTPNDLVRFWSKVKKTDNCWEWTACKSRGYGQFWLNGKLVYAHIFSYKLANGDIPDGFQLDHLCRNRKCVNPDHVEAVSQKENILRGIGITAQNAKKTHCPHGHEYSEENTRLYKNGKYCLECNIIHQRNYREEHREEIIGYSKKYYKANKEKIKIYQKNYREAQK